MKNYPSIGIQVPDILLPAPGVDLARWAVIACDQFTSEPDYWRTVERSVGQAPSTLNMILPEVYLEDPDVHRRIESIQANMQAALATGALQEHPYMIYVERESHGHSGKHTRNGLMLALDLEHYDYNKGSSSLIRATEGTILERLPPRIRIRSGAPLELPHILVLIDDPAKTVIEPLAERVDSLPKLYDFELMQGSGHLRGYAVSDPALEAGIVQALQRLADPAEFAAKYQVPGGTPVLLFAMGDGNHSLATAKAIWEQIKGQVGANHPARYALVEIENVHDEGLEFEPIHRILFNLRKPLLPALHAHFGERLAVSVVDNLPALDAALALSTSARQRIGLVTAEGLHLLEITGATSNLPVGSLQAFLDSFMKQAFAEKIDYVHGEEIVQRLGSQPGNAGFFLPGMDKGDLFRTVILDGALPRKTFSMGEAHEKRFYMEARRIG